MVIMSRKRKLTSKVLLIVALIIVVVWAAFPIYWAVVVSIKPRIETFSVTYISVPFLQFRPTLRNWIEDLRHEEIRRSVLNSLVVSTSSAFLALFLGTLAGYALARFKFHTVKNKDWTVWFLSQRVLPPVVVVIPFFLIMKTFKLLDTHLALILAYTTFNLPFAVVIMRQMFKELPDEIEEAALVDGCTHFGVFFRVAIPLVAPAVAATFIICLAFAWNELLFALTLSSKDAVTLPVFIAGSQQSRGVAFWFAATRSLIAALPPTALALLIQPFIVRGLTFGAVKG
ncbi:MAG: Inner membrane ABC transporter permease protein YcjP [Syntrophomonadaceae bacterium]|nr:Inner membrane ABC transporter permease protein YcjP [Bacillota bacterium]